MIYNRKMGKIYDTIFFLISYFNPKEIENQYLKVYDDTVFMVDCYDQIKADISDIPDYISPFFICKDNAAVPISEFLSQTFDLQNGNIDSFISIITERCDLLQELTFKRIFSDDTPDCSSSEYYIKAIQDLDASSDLKMNIAILFSNLPYAITVLSSVLRQVYSSVDKLHTKYARDLSLRFEQMDSNDDLNLCRDILKLDSVRSNSAVFSICLVNQYIICDLFKKDTFFIICGYNYQEVMLDQIDVSDAAAKQFMICCGNRIRYEILLALIKNKELTISKIAQIIDSPVTTINRHVSMLHNNHLIYVSRQEGLKIFYRLNIKLFEKMRINIDRLFDLIINIKE